MYHLPMKHRLKFKRSYVKGVRYVNKPLDSHMVELRPDVLDVSRP